MNIRILPVLGLALIALAACGDQQAPMQPAEVPARSSPAPAPTPPPEANAVITTENLARIAARIYLSPEDKDAILAEASMAEGTFKALIEQIALDAEAAFHYARAFEVELDLRSD